MGCKTTGTPSNATIALFPTPSVDEWSVFVWIIGRGAGGDPTQYIINNLGSGAASFYIAWYFTDKYLDVVIDNSNGTRYQLTSGNNTILQDTLYHVGFTYKRNDFLRGYINAVEYDNVATADFPTRSNANDILLHKHHLANSNRFNGESANEMFYDSQLSVPEIESVYHSHGKYIPDDPYAYYRINEKTTGTNITGASSVIDISGSSRHGTPADTPKYVEMPMRIT